MLPSSLPTLPRAQAAGCRERSRWSLQNSDQAGALVQTSSENLCISILSVKGNTQTPPFTRGENSSAAKHCVLVTSSQLYFASRSFFNIFF